LWHFRDDSEERMNTYCPFLLLSRWGYYIPPGHWIATNAGNWQESGTKKEQQYTYGVRLRCFRLIIVAVESNKYDTFWVFVISLRYPGCNAHMPYSHVWPARHYNIFPHYYINGKIFGKRCWTNVCVLILSTTFVWDVSHFKKNWARYDHKRVKYQLFLSHFNDTWISSMDFRKILKLQIKWKSVHWEPSCTMLLDGRTDRQTWRS
jgi:hypothetical protein